VDVPLSPYPPHIMLHSHGVLLDGRQPPHKGTPPGRKSAVTRMRPLLFVVPAPACRRQKLSFNMRPFFSPFPNSVSVIAFWAGLSFRSVFMETAAPFRIQPRSAPAPGCFIKNILSLWNPPLFKTGYPPLGLSPIFLFSSLFLFFSCVNMEARWFLLFPASLVPGFPLPRIEDHSLFSLSRTVLFYGIPHFPSFFLTHILSFLPLFFSVVF